MRKNKLCIVAVLLLSLAITGCSQAASIPEPSIAPTSTPVSTPAPTMNTVEFEAPEFTHEDVNGLECYKLFGSAIPVALGEPRYSWAQICKGATFDIITNYGEALTETKKSGPDPFSSSSASIVMNTASLLKGVYDEVGMVQLMSSEGGIRYALLYILDDNTYYVFDSFSTLRNESTWLDWFGCMKGYDTDLDTLCQNLQKNYHFQGDVASYTTSVISSKDTLTDSLDRASCFDCTNSTVPENLQLPEAISNRTLSNDEMNKLIENDNPEEIAKQISTVADCICYFVKADFCYGDGMIRNSRAVCSAFQTIDRKVGQCASISSCMNFILWGDYDEIGYIVVSSHVMIYIKQDGIYYSINPTSYLRDEKTQPAGEERCITDYTKIWISDDFEKIAKELVVDYGTEYVYTISWPYSFDTGFVACGTFPEENFVCWVGKELNESSGDISEFANDIFVDEESIILYDGFFAERYGEHYVRTEFPYYKGK